MAKSTRLRNVKTVLIDSRHVRRTPANLRYKFVSKNKAGYFIAFLSIVEGFALACIVGCIQLGWLKALPKLGIRGPAVQQDGCVGPKQQGQDRICNASHHPTQHPTDNQVHCFADWVIRNKQTQFFRRFPTPFEFGFIAVVVTIVAAVTAVTEKS